MTSKDEVPMVTQSVDQSFLQDALQKHKELSRRQREYKKTISLRLKTRAECILERSYIKTIERLKTERNELRAQIWVANGRCHQIDDAINLEQVECHVKCQERMAKQIKELKTRISNMEHQIGRVDKQIYELNRKTVPDSQHQEYVKHARKRIVLLENIVEVGIRRECGFTAENTALREELKILLKSRARFHDSYSKLVQRLNIEKKYLLDLLEYACNTFAGAIELNEKIANVKTKMTKDNEQAKLEMQSIMRNSAAAELGNDFMVCKNHMRALADLQPSEYKRRIGFKRRHVHKITLYNTVLSKLYDFTSSYNIDTVIEKYQHQESVYYSYFSMANELSFHITLLENSAHRLFANVMRTKVRNRDKMQQQKGQLAEREAKLSELKGRNEVLQMQFTDAQKQLGTIFEGIAQVFNLCLADATPLIRRLGDHTFINLYNVHSFLKILEGRILNVVRSVYIKERQDGNRLDSTYVVKELEKIVEYPTALDDIVLTQQCPECAEGETLNMEDGETVALSVEETRKVLFEKVNQPEMQYRLHSISQCRLPRSRLLAAKRNA